MATIIIGMQDRDGKVLPSKPIQARWKGKNLAVHAALTYRSDIEDVGPMVKESRGYFRFRITHLATGFAAARFNRVNDAIKIAKIFDEFFNHLTKSAVQADKEFVELFRAEVTKNGGLLCP